MHVTQDSIYRSLAWLSQQICILDARGIGLDRCCLNTRQDRGVFSCVKMLLIIILLPRIALVYS